MSGSTEFTELVATAIANAESRAELAASRARIVATADATRRRIERDLHDGAQQQLVSLALELRAAQAALPSELVDQRAELSRVVEGLTAVLDELREISSGIHPAILSEGGLAPALKTLARRSPIPVAARRPRSTSATRKRGGCCLLRRGGNAHERREARACVDRPRGRGGSRRSARVYRSATTASAAPIRRAARASSGCVTASRPSAGWSPSIAPGAKAPRSRSHFHSPEGRCRATRPGSSG